MTSSMTVPVARCCLLSKRSHRLRTYVIDDDEILMPFNRIPKQTSQPGLFNFGFLFIFGTFPDFKVSKSPEFKGDVALFCRTTPC